MATSHTTTLLSTLLLLFLQTTSASIGINYGMYADNLPPPTAVANFLKSKTIIDRVRLFDSNPDVLRAFANSGISLSITAPNGDIPNLTQLPNAQQWVATNVAPFHPATNIERVLIGTEVLHWGPQNLIDNLVSAMRTMRQALDKAGFTKVQVSTAHSLGILETSWPPSTGKFRPGWDIGVLAPVLKFHRETKTPFIVNPYPYFAANAKNYQVCIFQYTKGWRDPNTHKVYHNMFDILMDAVYSSMKRLGYDDVEIVVGETGWPSVGEDFQKSWVNSETAEAYTSGLVKHVESGKGTPLMPNKKFEVFLFALFDENQKPGGVAEKHFGVFNTDFTPAYPNSLLRDDDAKSTSPSPKSSPSTGTPTKGKTSSQWCVPKASATPEQLQSNIDYVCSQPDIDCKPINSGGPCFDPNNVRSHATYAMNAYFQARGVSDKTNCDFAGTGLISQTDPSYDKCVYAS